MKSRVVVIEDDPAIQQGLRDILQFEGYEVLAAEDGATGYRLVREQKPALVILDVMLPGMDGFEVCRKVREKSRVPIVMLTARGGVMDRIVGLELGADDYLPKPFEPRELVARLQAVLRRGGAVGEPAAETLRVGALEIQWDARATRLSGRPLELTTAEFELLGLLVKSRGRVLTRDRILEATRGLDWEAYDRSIDVLVSRLRQKLGDDPRHPAFIKTVRGLGYRFIGGSE